ncbi:hypothetical protein QVD17_17607 [Tagetes erecta]|uniref:Serpin domain-containing protein n=1 Tax=Tagetes erecta TaxID=13708 RepID=A0AAD8KTD0_TARER|nr:hypothetical protein QVD17_17607 [Tagetes erecta]
MSPISRPPIFNFKPRHRKRHAKARNKAFRPQQCVVHPPTTSTDQVQSITNQTHVSTTLATHLLSNKFNNSNVVFSPLSIHVVLSILAAGSEGPTHDQVLGFLKANTSGDLNSLYLWLVPFIFADGSLNGGPRLSVANGVWVHKSFSIKRSFKHVVDNVYKAACKRVDFRNKGVEVVNEVNSWAEKQTSGLIKQVLPDDVVNRLTSLIFANAIYFKGLWSHKFNRSKTEESDFFLLDGNKVQVPFMTSTRDQFVREYDDFKVLGLPYSQGQEKRQFTMYFFLPHENNGLHSLVEKISSTFDFIDRHIPRRKVQIRDFMIPKFKISVGFEASDMLKKLGLVLPFNDEDGNGLTEMVHLREKETLFVSSIHHKSFVDVNEEGTEAAAVSVLTMEWGCPLHEDEDEEDFVDFVADHPFLFVIREDVTGVVLFIGQVTDPSIKNF